MTQEHVPAAPGAPTDTPTATPLAPHYRATIERMIEVGARLIKLREGVKQPAGEGWKLAPALSSDEADAHVLRNGNLGVSLGPSRMIVFDCEDQLATDAVIDAGFTPTVSPAKSLLDGILNPKANDRDAGKRNKKIGGSHIWLHVPDYVDASLLSSEHSMQLQLPGGGVMDVLAGARYVVAPPSALDLAYGWRYQWLPKGALDLSIAPQVMDAPRFLFDLKAPCPPELAPLHGCLIPRVREKVEYDARSVELTNQIDGISWPIWIDGDHRIEETGMVDGCGCPIYHFQGASSEKSMTLHEGCGQGYGIHIWSGTMIGELGLDRHHMSRLDLACALRGESRHAVAAAHGIQLGEERQELGIITPGMYERMAQEYAEAGDTRSAAMYRQAAETLRATQPTLDQRGETMATGMVFGAPAPSVSAPEANMATVTQLHAPGAANPTVAPPIGTIGGISAPTPVAGFPGGAAAKADAAPAKPTATDPGDFPLHALPKVLRDHAEWVMDAKHVPAAMVAPMQLAVLNAACGRAKIWARNGWAEDAALWFLVIAPPSTRKSPTLDEVRAPLDSAQEELIKRMAEIRGVCKLDAEVAQEALDEARRVYKEAKDKADSEARAARIAAAAGARPTQPGDGPTPHAPSIGGPVTTPGAPNIGGPVPMTGPPNIGGVDGTASELHVLRETVRLLEDAAAEAEAAVPGKVRLYFDDATPEAMQNLLYACGGKGFACIPEGVNWFERATRTDSRQMELGDFLKAYSAEKITVDRIQRGEFVIEDPFLTMLVIIQPKALKKALKGRDGESRLQNNGAWARFAASYVPRIGPDYYDRPIPEGTAVKAAYNWAVEREFLRTFGIAHTPQFRLSEEADAAVGAVYNRVERIKYAADDDENGMAEEWGKTVGRALRIARMFAQLRVTDEALANPTAMHEINRQDFEDAWEITEWLTQSQAHAVGATAAVTSDELLDAAVTWMRNAVRSHGVRTERQFSQNKTHKPYWEAARDILAGDGEIIQTEAGWVPGPDMAA
ncbi:Bifunctional DNA primase/polymerase, N-terminal [Mycobacteroides abscessus subsp. abscessus]|uniref:DUF3987 domain-containing protein n=1 Tax=Mycobacteroides abscessus TaxID=36809 RepID=UPI0009A63913|nr:DUF3987 domain-containing protein [Mycobacteroides abscessus]SLJ23381.1 Bifunctional DNA primase/polymerase, N-terminal [Mycobacteroides abscessus subsp. abscessus]